PLPWRTCPFGLSFWPVLLACPVDLSPWTCPRRPVPVDLSPSTCPLGPCLLACPLGPWLLACPFGQRSFAAEAIPRTRGAAHFPGRSNPCRAAAGRPCRRRRSR